LPCDGPRRCLMRDACTAFLYDPDVGPTDRMKLIHPIACLKRPHNEPSPVLFVDVG
jgi:hypothetical protein